MVEKIVKDSQGLAKELVNGVKEFEELKVIDLNGRPYYSIIYLENGNKFEGYSSYNLKVISEYLKRHFGFAQPETHDKRTEKHACDLISRQAAIEKLISNLTYMHTFGADRSIDLIEELPSAQPEPRIGKWLIRKFGDDGKCSVCGMYCGEYDLEGSDRYCRCCGAKMEGLEVIK